MNLIKKIFNFVLFAEVTMFFVFFLQNIGNLNEIDYAIPFVDFTLEFTLNMYILLPVLILVYVVIMLLSNNIAGLNEEGSRLAMKITGLIILQGLLTLITLFYFSRLGNVGTILQVFMSITFGLQAINILTEDSE